MAARRLGRLGLHHQEGRRPAAAQHHQGGRDDDEQQGDLLLAGRGFALASEFAVAHGGQVGVVAGRRLALLLAQLQFQHA
ncbi:hypothetical protein D3C77_527550 [compost metagenome]